VRRRATTGGGRSDRHGRCHFVVLAKLHPLQAAGNVNVPIFLRCRGAARYHCPMASTALQRVDGDAIARDVSRLVRVPSITGSERAVAAEFVAIAREQGLQAELVAFDLQALRAAPGYPGEEAPRDELVAAIVTLRAAIRRRRGCASTATSTSSHPERRRGGATPGRVTSQTAASTGAARST